MQETEASPPSDKEIAMPGKLKITGNTKVPNDPMLVKAYCEGRAFKKGGGSITPATGTTGTVGANNGLTYTSVVPGDGVQINLINPGGNSKSLAVSVAGTTVNVSLATSSVGAITSTAAQVDTAIGANTAANALVSVANTGASTGAGVVAAANVRLTGSSYKAQAGDANAQAFVDGMASYGGGAAGARDCCAILPTA
jgi:hypothetical protein